MSATLGAVVRAPVTSILIVFEMTHEFSLMPPLMLGALVAQAISRRMTNHNFYDELLEQDGHDVERFVPPRDLRAWQSQPVSMLANPRPVVIQTLASDALQKLLATHPFDRFPVMENGELIGVLMRDVAQLALREKRAPELHSVHTCAPDETLHVAGARLVESTSGMVILQAGPDGPVLGILTLHDLLRAQMAAAERGQGMEG